MENGSKKRLRRERLKRAVPVALAVAAVAAFYLTLGCPVRFFTGVCCPGCGMSRAALRLAMLDFAEAFRLHPMIYAMPFFALALFLTRRRKRAFRAVLAILCVCLVGVYVWRLCDPAFRDVVYFAPETGAVWRAVARLRELLHR